MRCTGSSRALMTSGTAHLPTAGCKGLPFAEHLPLARATPAANKGQQLSCAQVLWTDSPFSHHRHPHAPSLRPRHWTSLAFRANSGFRQ